MPTGYTYKVQSGEIVDHKEFLWNVAHMFGGFICVGEDFNINSDAEKHIKMSTYHEETINRLQKELEEYKSMSDDELQKMLDDKYNKSLKENEEVRKKYKLERKRYEDMLSKVCSWNPPTEEHANIKKEAIKQLNDSIECDCCEEYITEPVKYDAREYRVQMIEHTTERLAREYDEWSKQLKAHKNRIEWMKSLQDSLK